VRFGKRSASLTSVRKTSSKGEPDQQPPRLPLRWALIIGTAAAVATGAAAAEGGVVAAIVVFFAAAALLHAMLG
jgi:hypothetical protein